MPYPGQPVPDPLPQFVGTATVRQTRQQRQALLTLVERGYLEGRSLRFLAAQADRGRPPFVVLYESVGWRFGAVVLHWLRRSPITRTLEDPRSRN